MNLNNGFYDVPDDKLATIVTSLEMFAKPAKRKAEGHPNWRLEYVAKPTSDQYCAIYRKVGLEWLWFSRIMMPKQQLAAIISDPLVEIRFLKIDGEIEGLLELDYRTNRECELAFLGVSEKLLGMGAGSWLMQQALDLAWSTSINRLWIHTCTLDHPNALPFYIKSGFKPFKRQLEIADDPRISGDAPGNTAAHYPLLG